MTDEQIRLIIGSLLHDVGKVVFRQGDDKRSHSISGYDFLKDEIGIDDEAILNCVRYHHAAALRSCNIKTNDIAYITYIADNIASAADRRKSESEDVGFEISAPLESVFNILNGNNERKVYSPTLLNLENSINYPTDKAENFDEHFYSIVRDNLQSNLKGIDYSSEYINSLLEVLEANLSYVPSSTAKAEKMDVSLYDHVKLTAAVACCILEYSKDKEITDFRKAFFEDSERFYSEEAFLLYSMDISGIQEFIYTITSANALRTLRARSFYLEIMMENVIDGLLDRLELSRANLIYEGGGHCYMLLPNTKKVIDTADAYNNDLNQWLLDMFKTSLFVADGYCMCSSDSLKNNPSGSYSEIFRTVGNMISEKKNSRYSPKAIIELNRPSSADQNRECKVCKRMEYLNDEDECSVCSAIRDFSKSILYDEFFVVTTEKSEGALPLPMENYLIAANEKKLIDMMQHDDNYVRAYSKNRMYTGKHVATKIWVGSYTSGKSFEEMADDATGISRIGVFRADVDNLGHAFVEGFANTANDNRYVTLSRTAALSRHLSLFYKLYINKVLEEGKYAVGRSLSAGLRNATICYSGGDDLFIVGAWNEVIEIAVDINRCFEKYSQGTLTISGGLGVYNNKYPISAIAGEVLELEEESKKLPGKNAITLFDNETYNWSDFISGVLEDKFLSVKTFFDNSDERGKNFLYNLLELIRNRSDRINFARFVYVLSRLEPGNDASIESKEDYKVFSKKMYEWVQNDNDSRELKTAINLYAFLNREKEDKK